MVLSVASSLFSSRFVFRDVLKDLDMRCSIRYHLLVSIESDIVWCFSFILLKVLKFWTTNHFILLRVMNLNMIISNVGSTYYFVCCVLVIVKNLGKLWKKRCNKTFTKALKCHNLFYNRYFYQTCTWLSIRIPSTYRYSWKIITIFLAQQRWKLQLFRSKS